MPFVGKYDFFSEEYIDINGYWVQELTFNGNVTGRRYWKRA